MTEAELERLAALIAAELQRVTDTGSAGNARGEAWLSIPVRPEPPTRSSEPPVWAAAAQSLGDIAPVRSPEPSHHRDDQGSATAAIRAAAAGTGGARPGSPRARVQAPPPAPIAQARGGTRQVSIGVSKRHVHLSEGDARLLFGGTLTRHRALTQPGQFAAEQQVTVTGPAGHIEGVRVVGPARGQTQLELAVSDSAILGITPPVANSGKLASSGGGVTLTGPRGTVQLHAGVIVAARHLHLAPGDARRWHLADGDVVTIRCGTGARATTWHGVLVRSGEGHATEFHIDSDEARACGASSGDPAWIVESRPGNRPKKTLVTERDVIAMAARGEALSEGVLLTPSARDRARALGLKLP